MAAVDADHALTRLPLPEPALGPLASLPRAVAIITDEIEQHHDVHAARCGSVEMSGWSALTAIAHWGVFGNVWHKLRQTLTHDEINETVAAICQASGESLAAPEIMFRTWDDASPGVLM